MINLSIKKLRVKQITKELGSFKVKPRNNRLEISSCYIDLRDWTGYSYNWYEICKVINGQMVLNSYNYSPTTIKHYHKVRTLLNQLGIEVTEVRCPRGLQDIQSGINLIKSEITKLQELINKPRTHKATNERRERNINTLRAQLDRLNALVA